MNKNPNDKHAQKLSASHFPSLNELVEQFNTAQRLFLETQEFMDYYWSMDTLTFEVESEQEKLFFPVIPIGSWSPHTEQFTWAYEMEKLPPAAQETARTALLPLQDISFLPQYALQPIFDLPHVALDDILAIAHYVVGSHVVFKEKNMEPWLFLALLTPSVAQ